MKLKLLAKKDTKNISLLTQYNIFLCRGRGYRRIPVCPAYKSYISAHPYHSQNDISIDSKVELHKIDNKLIVTVYYYESNSADKIINDNFTVYLSRDNGMSFMEVQGSADTLKISEKTLIDSLTL